MAQGPFNPGPFNPYTAPGPQMPPVPPYGAPGGSSRYEYEFNDAENAAISSAAFWARLLGIFMIITGAVSLLNCNVLTFAIDLAVGIALLGAASSFNMVVSTEGNDIAHMMTALGKLGSAFKIRVIVVIVAMVLVGLVGAGLLLMLVLAGTTSR